MYVRPDFRQVGDDRIIGSGEWLGGDGIRHESYQVLTLRNGQIVDMQGCTLTASSRTPRSPPLDASLDSDEHS